MSSGNMKLAPKKYEKLEPKVSNPSNKKTIPENPLPKNSDLINFKKISSVRIISEDHSVSLQSKCPGCQALLIKVKEIGQLKSEISFLKKQNQEFKDQIQLLSSNFSYVLELAAENIMKGVKSRIKNLLVEKQNIIQKQSQIIKRLQSESLNLINKMDEQMESQQKIGILQEKLKQLAAENQSLKKKNSNKSNCFNFELDQSIQLNSTDICSGGFSPKDLSPANFPFKSMDLGKDKLGFGLKKRRTLEGVSVESQNNLIQDSQQINLQSLKQKINKMKQQIINQKF